MSWYALAKGLRDIAIADTGAGGLFGSSDPLLIGGWYTNEAAQDVAMPYVVATLTSIVENNVFLTTPECLEITFQFGSWVNKVTEAAPHDKLQDIITRIRTKYRRVTPTVAGWSTVSQIVFQGEASTEVYEEALYTTIEAFIVISK